MPSTDTSIVTHDAVPTTSSARPTGDSSFQISLAAVYVSCFGTKPACKSIGLSEATGTVTTGFRYSTWKSADAKKQKIASPKENNVTPAHLYRVIAEFCAGIQVLGRRKVYETVGGIPECFS